MWKESYRIGIERIDEQHIELFRMVDELLTSIENNDGKLKFEKTIEFLKNYVVFHFKEEEAYQASINYSDIKSHKKAHEEFTNTVLEFEKQLIESDYDIKIVKKLAGTLMTWLIYHVADADQKIANGEHEIIHSNKKSYISSFTGSIIDVFEKMLGLNSSDMNEEDIECDLINGDVFVSIGLKGDIKGNAVFGFSKKLAFKLIEIMTFTEPDKIDEFVCSALAEFANISSGNAAMEMSTQGTQFDIEPPIISVSDKVQSTGVNQESMRIDTSIGHIEIFVEFD